MVEMMKKVSVVRMFVQIRGIVILKNCVKRPAPSYGRALVEVHGTAAMEAMYMTM